MHSVNERMELHNVTFKRPKLAQSVKSRVFHFTSKICENCNTNLTQSADNGFERFHRQLVCGLDTLRPKLVDGYVTEGDFFDNTAEEVFRYFAKLLCGFMADSNGPRPKSIAAFAIGSASHNPVFLSIRVADCGSNNPSQVAAHGGLMGLLDKKQRFVNRLICSLTLGPVTYEFWVQLRWFARLELTLFHQYFLEHCRASVDGNML
ncbi:hypothetical protein [Roseovarius rhodophyticola]|uniref:Uncharacterized protein n=1 Tax=Roseovarius rhodophyticola TaxID=3080827 RepID=A0ABZ2TB94_9RHOB|nr:hypothetical protein [Roseovarius sp. W115]